MPEVQTAGATERAELYPVVKARVKCSRCGEVYVVPEGESVKQAQERHRREECRGSV